MDKIIVYTSPVAPLQKIFIMKDGKLVDQVGITPNYITDVVIEAVNKYQVKDIDFTGSESFAENFMNELKTNQISVYGHECLNINFVEGA